MVKITIVEDNTYYGNAITEKIKKELECEVSLYKGYNDFIFSESDIFIVDLKLNGKTAINLIKSIREKTTNLIIILSASSDISCIIKALKAGADTHHDKGGMLSPKLFVEKLKAQIRMKDRLLNK